MAYAVDTRQIAAHPEDKTLLIAPHIDGQAYCPEAAADPQVNTDDEAEAKCLRLGSNAAPSIRSALDALGPQLSPSGRYRLGYLLSLPVMRYLRKVDGRWTVDRDAIRFDLSLVRDVDRPVVLYISANHFTDAAPETASELASDPRNLMWTAEGPLRSGQYFGVGVHAWTLADEQAPINVLRRQTIAAIADEACRMAPAAVGRIAAVSLLGEVHQLYPEFPGNEGYRDPLRVSDYSAPSLTGFHIWLRSRFSSVAALNVWSGAHFHSLSDVAPPSKGVLAAGDDPSTHLDASAAGDLAIYGWSYDSSSKAAVQVTLYVDGQKVQEAPSDLNRPDVPEADQRIRTPNVGWRFDYDYRKLPPGEHVLDLMAQGGDGRRAHFGYRRFTVVGSGTRAGLIGGPKSFRAPGSDSDLGLRLAIDGPADNARITYNPLAELWLRYREAQVRSYYETFAEIVRGSCLAHVPLFSHEITPQLNGTWNPELFAVAAAQRPDLSYLPGSTLYGGAAFGDAFFRFKASEGWGTYAVSELHPTFDLSVAEMKSMLERHRRAGARFIAPYYLCLKPKRVFHLDNKLYRWRIQPDNPQYGSAHFYTAIRELMTSG